MGNRFMLVVLAVSACGKGGEKDDGKGKPPASPQSSTGTADGKSKPPTTPQELAGALIAALNAHDEAAADALLPTAEQIKSWVSCDPTNEWVGEQRAEVARELPSAVSKGPCTSGKCKVTTVVPQSGDEPQVLQKDQTLNGCTWSTETTMAADQMITFSDGGDPTTWRIELWLVGGRAYLMDIDG